MDECVSTKSKTKNKTVSHQHYAYYLKKKIYIFHVIMADISPPPLPFSLQCHPPLKVQDLFVDIQDGRILMALLEELTGCKLVRVKSTSAKDNHSFKQKYLMFFFFFSPVTSHELWS